MKHNRYLDYYAKDVGDREYHKAKDTPTFKQKKFYYRLYAMCKENNIDTSTGDYTVTRAEYADAIDKLIKRLQEHGINVSGNNKDAVLVLTDVDDRRGRNYINEQIKIKDEPNKEI